MFLARLSYKDVEGFRIDAVLLGSDIVTRGGPLQRSSETFRLPFGRSQPDASRSKISLELFDPLCRRCAPLPDRSVRSCDLPNFPKHLLSDDVGHDLPCHPIATGHCNTKSEVADLRHAPAGLFFAGNCIEADEARLMAVYDNGHLRAKLKPDSDDTTQ